MSTISNKRLILGWLLESFWYLLLFLTSPLTFFWNKRFQQGHREQTVLILCDVFATPLTYLRLAARLHRKGFSVWTLSTGSIYTELDKHAHRLGAFLEEQNLKQVILIAHGAGGLIALKLPDAPRQRIHHLMPVGTPFNGTRLLLPFQFIPALRDMAVGSKYLFSHRTNAMFYPEFTPFTAWQDETITPFNLSRFGQGRDLIVDQVGHLNLILEKDNMDTLVEILDESYPDLTSALNQAQPAMQKLESRIKQAGSKVPKRTIKNKKVTNKSNHKSVAPASKKQPKKRLGNTKKQGLKKTPKKVTAKGRRPLKKKNK